MPLTNIPDLKTSIGIVPLLCLRLSAAHVAPSLVVER